MTQDDLDAMEYALLTLAKEKKAAKVEEVRMDRCLWAKIEIKKENDDE